MRAAGSKGHIPVELPDGGCMRGKVTLLAAAIMAAGAMTVLGQGQGQPADPERTPGVQAGADPKAAAWVTANCKTPPEAPAQRGGGPGAPGGPGGGGRAGGGAPPAPPTASEDYMVTAIPGVIAANARWKLVWEDKGNNAD